MNIFHTSCCLLVVILVPSSMSLPSPNLIISGDLSISAISSPSLSPSSSSSSSFSSSASLARYDLGKSEWSHEYHPELFLYGKDYGEVYKLVSNHTKVHSPSSPSELIVVGAYDTVSNPRDGSRDSQVQYCSVGKWDGYAFSNVGQGLCESQLSKGMKVTTATFGNDNKVLFVAGSFETEAWYGKDNAFKSIYNIAVYNGTSGIWGPLKHGQLDCSWCTVDVLAMAWDEEKGELHVGGKFNAVIHEEEGSANIPPGLAVYRPGDGHLVASPAGGVTQFNIQDDGVVTSLQFDPTERVLYVMGSFQRLQKTSELCAGLAAYEVDRDIWTCLASDAHSVMPSSEGAMLLTKYGLMVAGRVAEGSTWMSETNIYTIALLSTSSKTVDNSVKNDKILSYNTTMFEWSWLPDFSGHIKPLHALANGFHEHDGDVFVGGEDYLAVWNDGETDVLIPDRNTQSFNVTGKIMSVAQLSVKSPHMVAPIVDKLNDDDMPRNLGFSIVVYFLSLGALLGMALSIMCNRRIWAAMSGVVEPKGINLDTLTTNGYGSMENSDLNTFYSRAMLARNIESSDQITLINPTEITLHKIIGEGTYGRVWAAKWRTSMVAVKEFVFAQAAVLGKSHQKQEIVEEIIGEAGTMSCLRHPHILQLYGCSLTSQAIWIVSELCSLGSLRQVLDDKTRPLPMKIRLSLAIDVANGMAHLHQLSPVIIHRDLKSHNIFVQAVGGNIVAKIGDWGSARAALAGSQTMTHGIGTACWLAPEVILHAHCGKKSDAFAFGIILWELWTRREVFEHLTTTQIIALVANEGLRPEISVDMENRCVWLELMKKCWAEDPEERLDFVDILAELQAIQSNEET